MKDNTDSETGARSRSFRVLLTLLGLSLSLHPQTSLAQSITPTPDNTGTIIEYNGNTYTITGGTQSGQNLFHSFQEFGLSTTEIADFLANPQVSNILGRVTGGNASIINGLLQVTNSNANLYLMNPAGIVFGNNARLDVNGSFFATTADAIGLDEGYFTATGTVDYATLSGSPGQFVFASGQGGIIVNNADLSLNPGNTLGLIGGTVINTGTITAPDSNITLTAVPENRSIRINQDGMILGLEVPQTALDSGIAALDLPQLLAKQPDLNLSGDIQGNVIVSGHIQGNTVTLAAADTIFPQGDPTRLIRTHNGQYSAPTVTRFAPDISDPNIYTFLDATVPDYTDLLYNTAPGTTTIVVTPTENGIAKITETLTTPGLTPVDELHIVSEGNQGNFWLGNAFVDSDSLSQYQASLQQWGQGLSSNADILLYACLTAAGSVGEALLNDIALYTGADVAGSTTITGNAALGGDWVLERQIGNIEADLPFNTDILQNYADTLALLTVANGNDSGMGSLREAIEGASGANNQAGDDEIRFAPGVTLVSLTSDEINIDTTLGGLLIDGDANGASNVTIERSTAAVNPFRVFNITGNNNVTFDAVTIQGGRRNAGDGGGINHVGSGTLTINNSTIRNNRARGDGGGIDSRGNVNITNSTISGNISEASGGGVNVYLNGGGISLVGSTVSGNTAEDGGGGIHTVEGTQINIVNSTISGNASQANGGGIVNGGGGGQILNSTITNNRADTDRFEGGNGGGLHSIGGTIVISNSIIAGNFDDSSMVQYNDLSGDTINGDGNNLIGDVTGAIGTIGTGSDLTFASLGITDVSQVLNPLADNGGAMQTHALVVGSPAIDAGNNASVPGGITTDQRGATRIFNNTVDIGAYEAHFGLIRSGTPQSATVNTAFATPLGVQFWDVFFKTPIAQSGVAVTFTVPGSGASGVLGNGVTVVTDASGFASNPFTANGIAGSYQVTATATGFAAAMFDLTNVAVAPPPAAPVTPSTPAFTDDTGCPPQCEEKDEITDAEEEAQITLLLRWQREATEEILDILAPIDLEISLEYVDYFDLDADIPTVTLAEAQELLEAIASDTGENPALIYVIFSPNNVASEAQPDSSSQKINEYANSEEQDLWRWQNENIIAQNEPTAVQNAQDSDILDLLLVTASGEPVRIPVRGATRERVLAAASQFRRDVIRPARRTAYLESSQQLYDWMIAPLEAELQSRGITNIAFIMNPGLRSLPIAALHDGEQFLIEHYSVGMMPSLALTDTRYRDIKNFDVLALGAEEFNELQPLPAVPIELSLITESLWSGAAFLNEDFTLERILAERSEHTYGILHLATHAEFNRGDPNQSYIQLWGDTQLTLDKLRALNLNDLPVELLVLSACRTALGSIEAELGFTGLAVQAGVKSALGSLWYVDDVGTLMLMSEFYAQLQTQPIKAEALRQAQLSLIQGNVQLEENAIIGSWGRVTLEERLTEVNRNLAHPYYWSAFTLVGSPW